VPNYKHVASTSNYARSWPKEPNFTERLYVQAKRWVPTVGRPEIQKFAGALHGQHATKGIFITTSDFSRDAIDYVSKIGSKIVLIDGSRLAELMIEFGVAVATDATYTVKRIDNDLF
jgi:restriction system protein